jgi:hypothetical protein
MPANWILMVGLALGCPLLLWADPSDLSVPKQTSHERTLERRIKDQSHDNEHARAAQDEFIQGSEELSDADEDQLENVQGLRANKLQVIAGKDQMTRTRQAFKKSLDLYGPIDPRTAAAKFDWTTSKHAMWQLLQSQRLLKENVHDGGRLVHNDKVVLDVQKRAMDSDVRYRAADDRAIRRAEKDISEDRKTTAPVPSLP